MWTSHERLNLVVPLQKKRRIDSYPAVEELILTRICPNRIGRVPKDTHHHHRARC
jgi:hypothetical protein